MGRFRQENIYRGDRLTLYVYCADNPVVLCQGKVEFRNVPLSFMIWELLISYKILYGIQNKYVSVQYILYAGSLI